MKSLARTLLVIISVFAVIGLNAAAFATDLPGTTAWTGFGWSGTPPVQVIQNPFTFTAPAGCLLKVTDAYLDGDQFDVYDDTTLLGTTSVPVDDGSQCGSNADACFLDPKWSHATFVLGPGFHSINITVIGEAVGFPSGSGYLSCHWQVPGAGLGEIYTPPGPVCGVPGSASACDGSLSAPTGN